MKNENFEYCKRIAEELEMYVNGDITNEEGEQASIYDYMEDILDFEITLNSQFSYTACRVYVTLGGPAVWIDTRLGTVELRWGNENSSYLLDPLVVDAVNDYFEEFYNCR